MREREVNPPGNSTDSSKTPEGSGDERRTHNRAFDLGARLFNAQQTEGFGALELNTRVWDEASTDGLTKLIDEIWEGYVRRSSEVAKRYSALAVKR